MRFLADEGVDRAIVEAIRRDGHDVRWMAEESDGTKDDAVLEAAVRDGLILITEDKNVAIWSIVSTCIIVGSCSSAKAESSARPSATTRWN